MLLLLYLLVCLCVALIATKGTIYRSAMLMWKLRPVWIRVSIILAPWVFISGDLGFFMACWLACMILFREIFPVAVQQINIGTEEIDE